MATLTTAQINQLMRTIQRDVSQRRFPIPITKPQLRNALEGIDTGFDTDESTMLGYIPQPVKNSINSAVTAGRMTAAQRTRLYRELFERVIGKRAEEGV